MKATTAPPKLTPCRQKTSFIFDFSTTSHADPGGTNGGHDDQSHLIHRATGAGVTA